MSTNSNFRDLQGERDPVISESRTTLGVSGMNCREWQVMVPDKCSLTRLDVLVGTAGVPGATQQAKLKISHVPSGTASRTFTHKGYCVATITASVTYGRKAFFPSATITLPAGSIVGVSQLVAIGTPVGVKLAYYFTKGHVQA